MVELNTQGKSHAESLVSAGNVDRDSSWSFSAADGDKLLGNQDWTEYGQWFLGVDASADSKTKEYYNYPFGKDGKVYRSGVIAAKQRAGQQGASAIESAADDLLDSIDQDNDDGEEERTNSARSRQRAKRPTSTKGKAMTIQELRDRLAELAQSADAIQATADASKRDLTSEEATRMDEIFAQFEDSKADIARREQLEGVKAAVNDDTPLPRKVRPLNVVTDDKPKGISTITPRNAQERARWGWQNFGDFAKEVYNAAMNPGMTRDPRLMQNASLSTFGEEGTGADGGFAVPPEWRASIMQVVQGEDALLSRTDQQQATGNTITFPNDETTAWQSSGGIQAYWDGEASAMSQSKPQILPKTVRLNRLTALVPVTDELLEDSAAMGSYVQRKAGEKIDFKVNDALINGTGAGMPLGITVSTAAVSVAKETSQLAATVVPQNLAKMWGRLYGPSRKNAVWLINQDVEQSLYTMLLIAKNVAGTENVGGAVPTFLPPGGYSGLPYATMFGRPIITTEACATLGTVGDVILADMSQYLTVVKATGLRSDVSIHLWFDQATTAFRFIFRLAGEPWLSKPITRKNGSNTLSHFVTLATRA